MISQPQILDNFKFLAALDLTHSITAGTVATPANIAKGEIVVTDLANVVLDTTTVLTAPQIKVIMGRGAGIPFVESKPLKTTELKSYAVKAYEAKVQEVLYYGYNAATGVGAFDVINNNFYDLNISLYNIWGTEASSLYIPVGGSYQSTSTATEEEIANGLYKNVIGNTSRFTPPIVLVELVSSAAGVAVSDAVIIQKGAKSITGAATLAPAVSVGDYVRLGSQSTTTDPVYKITATDGVSVITLDVPVQADFSGNAFQVVAATAQAGAFGIRFTGVNQPFILDSRPVFMVEFQGGLKNGGSTPIVKEVTPYLGNGTYELCRQEEAASWRNQGILYNYTEFPPIAIPSDLNPTGVYSTLNLGWGRDNKTLLTTGNFIGNVMLALEIDTLGTPNVYSDNIVGSAISVVDVIDALATSLGFTSQIGNL
jgi:hypothetical protein